MRIYNVLISKNQDEDPVFIEEKFSFTSFIFQSLWFFYHRLWIPAIALILIEYGESLLLKKGIIDETIFYSLRFSLIFFAAIFANTWYIESLKKKNYTLAGVIAAKNLDQAKLRFYQNNFLKEEC